jgi:hypothetical protein
VRSDLKKNCDEEKNFTEKMGMAKIYLNEKLKKVRKKHGIRVFVIQN